MKLKKLFALGMASVLSLSMMTGCTSAATGTSSGVQFDFAQNDSGFTPIFADYPYEEGVEEFYEFQHSYGEVRSPEPETESLFPAITTATISLWDT